MPRWPPGLNVRNELRPTIRSASVSVSGPSVSVAVVIDTLTVGALSDGALPISATATGASNGDDVYWVVYDSAGSAPNAAQVIAGNQQDGAAADESGSDVWPGPFSDTLVSGLARGNYRMAMVINNGINSNVIVSDAFEVDTVAPTISSSVPTDNAIDIAIDGAIAITFSENIELGTGNIVLRDNDGGFAALETFNVATGSGDGGGTVTRSGAVLTITPGANLANNIEHAVRIAATCIEDTYGNTFAGIADDTTLSFTTVAAAAGQALTALNPTSPFITTNATGAADLSALSTNDWVLAVVIQPGDGTGHDGFDGLDVEDVSATLLATHTPPTATARQTRAFKFQASATVAGNSTADVTPSTVADVAGARTVVYFWKCDAEPVIVQSAFDDSVISLDTSLTGTVADNPIVTAVGHASSSAMTFVGSDITTMQMSEPTIASRNTYSGSIANAAGGAVTVTATAATGNSAMITLEVGS